MLKNFLLFFLYFILFSECSFQNHQLSNVSILDSFAKMKDKLFDKTLVYGQLNGNSIVSGFNTGSYPIGIVINPFTHKIYVANEYSNTISVYDAKTDALEQTIQTGIFPYSIDINLFNNRVYVTNRGSNDISVIDGSTNLIIDKINTGLSPVGVSVDPSHNWIYVSNIDSNSISVIDGITDKVINTINNISTPYGIDVNPISTKIYVTNIKNASISVINSNNYHIIKTIKVEKDPVGIDTDVENNLIFVTNYLSNSLSIINGTNDSIIKSIKIGESPVGVKINPISKKVYISNIQSNTVTVLNETNFNIVKKVIVNPSIITERNEFPFKIPTNIKFPVMASYISIDPLTNLIYTTNTASDTISLIDGKNDKNIVRVNFQVNPENSGFIKCDGINNINQNNTIINTDTNNSCSAYPERGYVFNLWSGLILSEDNPVKFSVKEYGKIIANFKPTLSIDQYIFLIGGITGFISIILGWFFKGRQRRNFNKFIQIINEKLNDKEVLDTGKKIDEFEKIRQNLLNSYKKGSLTDFQFDYLDKKIINYIEKLNRIK